MERVVTTRIVSEPTPGEYYSRGMHCYIIILSDAHFFLFQSCSNGVNACALEGENLPPRGNIGDNSW